MPRLEKVKKLSANGKQKELLESVEKKMGRVPNILASMAQSPATLEFYLQSKGILGTGSFNQKTQEAIALVCAEENSCDYCGTAHAAVGKQAGLSDAEIAAAKKAESEDAKLSAILTFAKKMVATKAEVTDEDFKTLTSAGVTQAEVAELTANVAINIFTNYFNHINQTEVDF